MPIAQALSRFLHMQEKNYMVIPWVPYFVCSKFAARVGKPLTTGTPAHAIGCTSFASASLAADTSETCINSRRDEDSSPMTLWTFLQLSFVPVRSLHSYQPPVYALG